MEDDTLGLPPPEHLGDGVPDLHYFLQGDDTFALSPWLMKPYSRRQLKREDRIANYRISRGRRVAENAFGMLVSILFFFFCQSLFSSSPCSKFF